MWRCGRTPMSLPRPMCVSPFLQPCWSQVPLRALTPPFSWDSVANSRGLWLIADSFSHCPLLEKATRVTMVGHRSPCRVPQGTKQAQDKHLHSTHWNGSDVVLKKLRLASFGKPGLASFNSKQILVGCCNYL